MDCQARADYYGKQCCFGYALFEFRSAKKPEPVVCNERDCPYEEKRDAREQAQRDRNRGAGKLC